MKSTIKITEISKDVNGNKVVKYKENNVSKRIQTLGNLPYTHRNFTVGTKSFSASEISSITREIQNHKKNTASLRAGKKKR